MGKALVMTHLMNDGKLISVLKIIQKGYNYQVIFDNDLKLELSLDQLVEFRISLDKKFSELEIKNLIEESKILFWYNKTIKFISRKLRTKKEILDYLKNTNLDEIQISNILNKLTKNNYINDLLYSKYFLEDCINKLKGKVYFVYILKNKGIPDFIINEVVDSFDEEIVIDRLVIKFQKYQQSIKEYSKSIQIQKIKNNLLRSGFTSNTIEKVIDKINF